VADEGGGPDEVEFVFTFVAVVSPAGHKAIVPFGARSAARARIAPSSGEPFILT